MKTIYLGNPKNPHQSIMNTTTSNITCIFLSSCFVSNIGFIGVFDRHVFNIGVFARHVSNIGVFKLHVSNY